MLKEFFLDSKDRIVHGKDTEEELNVRDFVTEAEAGQKGLKLQNVSGTWFP